MNKAELVEKLSKNVGIPEVQAEVALYQCGRVENWRSDKSPIPCSLLYWY